MVRQRRETTCRMLALALLAGASLVAPSEAAERPSVLVLTYRPMGKEIPPELAEQTTTVVAAELEAAGIEVFRGTGADADGGDAPSADAAQKPAKDAPAGDPLAGERAQELIARAKLAMEEQEFGAAVNQLQKAVRLLDDNGDAVPDLRILPEAFLHLGAAYFQDGDEEAGEDALSKAIHFAPERVLDQTEFPPIFIATFNKVRHSVLQRPRAQIELKAKPGSDVLFDGRNLGKTPLLISDVLPGTHWVRLERPGEPIEVKKVVVRSKRETTLEFEGAKPASSAQDDDAGVRGAIGKNEINRGHIEQIRNAGRGANARFVLFGGIYKTDTAYNIYTAIVSVSDGSVGRAVEIAFDLDMLSAQIEVYKLAADLKRQLEAAAFERAEDAPVFPLAPKLRIAAPAPSIVAGREVKVLTVAAAPPPIEAPKPASVLSEPAAVAAAVPLTGAVRPAVPAAGVIPKDELDAAVPVATGGGGAVGVVAPAAETMVPIDEREGATKEGRSLWWLWVVIGVAAAGAAGAGGYLVLSQRAPDEGTLRIRW